MDFDDNFVLQFDDELLQIYFTEKEPEISNNLEDFNILPSEAVQAINTTAGDTGMYIYQKIKN